jgi:hypothetical protein
MLPTIWAIPPWRNIEEIIVKSKKELKLILKMK